MKRPHLTYVMLLTVAIIVIAESLSIKRVSAITFTVTTTADNGSNASPTAGSLRKAILDSNGGLFVDTISFAIPGGGVHTITPPTPLPAITDPVLINGWSQGGAGYTGPPLIEISGASAGAGATGLTITAGSCTVQGLVINRFSDNGILLQFNGANTIQGNYIGTNSAGTAASGNGIGVFIGNSPNNIVGGTTAATRNIISGNSNNSVSGSGGVLIYGTGSTGNRIQGNYIGTDVTGAVAVPNLQGVDVDSAFNNIVGGTTAAARNIISGNSNSGVLIGGSVPSSSGNVVQGDFIGTNAAGTSALSNHDGVVLQDDASNNTVGGSAAGTGNVISGNTSSGVSVTGFAGATFVQGNLIGTNAAGTAALGNGGNGVAISITTGGNIIGGTSPAAGNLISGNNFRGVDVNGSQNVFQNNLIGTNGAGMNLGNADTGLYILGDNNTIGGGVGLGNTIAFNRGKGLVVGSGTGNVIFTNSIFSNSGGLAIDLSDDGVTPNDALDADVGANRLQNFPLLGAAVNNGAGTVVLGQINSTPNTTFTIEFFSNPSCDASGNGEGQTFQGATLVTTAADGNTVFSLTLPFAVPVGQVITASATNNATHDTSEFSACKNVTAGTPLDVEWASASATSFDDGALIQWQTGLEVNNLGFNIYRDDGGKLSPVNSQLIAGSAFLVGSDIALRSGYSYQWWDAKIADCADCKSAAYWIEDRDINGKSGWHGPVYANPASDRDRPASIQQSKTLAALSATQGPSVPLEARAGLSIPTSAGLQLQSMVAAARAIKIAVKHQSWYRVTQPELIAAGLDTAVDPRTMQLFVDGKQLAIRVIGEDDGRFDSMDAVEFYGTGIDSAFSDARIYWLIAGKQPGLRLINVQSPAPPVTGGSFPFTVERKDRLIYFAALRNGERENFFGPVLATQPVEQSLTVQHIDQSAPQPAVLTVSLQGVTNFPHVVTAQLNGSDVGLLVFQGQELKEATISVPQSLVTEGNNQVRLIAQGGPGDVSLVDYVRLTYQHALTADGDSLRLTANAQQLITIDGFTNEAIQVFDVTEPFSVQQLTGAIVKRDQGGLCFAATVPGKGVRTLIAQTEDKANKAANITADNPSSWRNGSQGADLVIITTRDLFETVQELKQIRERDGLTVALVDIEDVYDEFSYGQKTPQAIQDFLFFAGNNWKKPIRYALFFGDASLDPKNYLGLGEFDLVPTKLIDTTFMETASDDWLPDFNKDGAADIAIGRLPARTVAEAKMMIEKIGSYEKSIPADESLLVSDRNDGYDFEGANAQLIPLLPADVRVIEIKRGQLGDQMARSLLIDAINRGQRLVNYAGHASANVWRGNIFNSQDASRLQNQEHLSVFVMMNCLNGYFQDPAIESLAEALLRAPVGGAIAVWASSAMTYADGQSEMNKELYRQLFSSGPAVRLGDAVIRAKAMTFDAEVRETWILFGDPTMRVR
ncbi:MAG TPA: C25 family cysteine peptidase [Blastocatellia bacterium]|nr:C25 family cysteine peptidase [Blastocatellia bacterium]